MQGRTGGGFGRWRPLARRFLRSFRAKTGCSRGRMGGNYPMAEDQEKAPGERPAASVCPDDAENSTPEAPAPRPAPLQLYDKPDVGCMIGLAGILLGVFLLPAAIWFGGIYVFGGIFLLLMVIATPWVNPTEKMAPGPKWAGRVITWLFLMGLVVAGYLLLINYVFVDRFLDERQHG